MLLNACLNVGVVIISILLKGDDGPKRLNKKETFNVPLDLLFYGSSIVASVTLLISIMGGLF